MREANTATLTLRVDPALRRAFVAACAGQDQTASQVVRAFMRDYLAAHGQGALPLADAAPASRPRRKAKG